MRNVVIALMDHDHRVFEAVQNAFLKKHARASDFVLYEKIAYRDGRQLTAQEMGYDCKVPAEHCSVFVEPAVMKEVNKATVTLAHTVIETLNYMQEILPEQARARLGNAVKDVVNRSTVENFDHTTEMMDLINPYIGHLPWSSLRKGSEFDVLIKRTNAEKDAVINLTLSVHKERNRVYWTQVSDLIPKLKGGMLFVIMGRGHGPEDRKLDADGEPISEKQANPLSDYRGDELPILYINDDLEKGPRKEL